jgi:hypothetical protein
MAGFRFALSLVLCGDFIQYRPGFAFYFNAGILVGYVAGYSGYCLRGIPDGFYRAALFLEVASGGSFRHASR